MCDEQSPIAVNAQTSYRSTPRAKPALGQVISLLKPKEPSIRYTTTPANANTATAVDSNVDSNDALSERNYALSIEGLGGHILGTLIVHGGQFW